MRFSKLHYIIHRRLFDPSKRNDLIELKYFMLHGRWRDKCPFYAEYPWEDIPAMCKDKYAKYTLSKLK